MDELADGRRPLPGPRRWQTARSEVDRTGVYILSGPDPDKPGVTRVYIGSGNSVAERIEQSAKKRDFWETAITVTTSDDDLSKGHAEWFCCNG